MLPLNRIKVLHDYVGIDQYSQNTQGMLTTIKPKFDLSLNSTPCPKSTAEYHSNRSPKTHQTYYVYSQLISSQQKIKSKQI